MENKINCIISAITTLLSTLLGDFWFLFLFLLILNILDYITGIMKAKYLKIISSKKGFVGAIKKIFLWVIVFIGFVLGIAFKEIGEILGFNLNWLIGIGYFTLVHCIINEIFSILENIIECDKGDIIPNWLVRGLDILKKATDEKANQIIDKFENKEKDENE